MKKHILAILFVILYSKDTVAAHSGGTVYADVNGLVCDFCAQAIEKMFSKQDAVESVQVDLNTKVVSVHFHEGRKLDNETITKLINDSGYDVTGLRYAD